MILNQPYITNTPELSSSSLELKCLFLALCIVFLVNTPMSYIKSGREDAFAKQLIVLEHTYLIHDKILRLLSSISKTDIAQSYPENPKPFNELRESFLASQDLIQNIAIHLVDKPSAKTTKNQSTALLHTSGGTRTIQCITTLFITISSK